MDDLRFLDGTTIDAIAAYLDGRVQQERADNPDCVHTRMAAAALHDLRHALTARMRITTAGRAGAVAVPTN